MTMAAAVKRFLDGHGFVYRVASHERTDTLEQAAEALGINQRQIARSVVLKDNLGFVMAVLPVTHRLDFKRLQQLMQRDLTVVAGKEADKLFTDCEPGSRPPLAEVYGMACVVDNSFGNCEDIYFEPGTHNALVHLTNQEFQDLLSRALKGSFAYASKRKSKKLASVSPITEKSSLVYHLPDVPLVKMLVEAFNEDEYPMPRSLMMELDKVPTLRDILAYYFEMVMPEYNDKMSVALAIGVVTVRALWSNIRGPFANRAIWRHALYSATMAAAIARLPMFEDTLIPHRAFLAALMQNVGVLLLGHLFLPEYRLLNRLGSANPGCSMELIERRLLGMGQASEIVGLGHERLGAWLLRDWGFPEEVIIAASDHHNPLIGERDNKYLLLVKCVNALLVEQGFDYLNRADSTSDYLKWLGLQVNDISSVYEKMLLTKTFLENILEKY